MSAAARTRTILIIEDDAAIRDGLAEVLGFEGFSVVQASDGAEALAVLARGGSLPGAIVLDLMMPRMNGWEFREQQLRDPRLAAIPVIVLSGVESLSEKAAPLRAAGCLEKPVDVDRLLALIDRHGR